MVAQARLALMSKVGVGKRRRAHGLFQLVILASDGV